MKHLLGITVAIPLLASSVAMAGEPMKLSNAQMDKVTAGAAVASLLATLTASATTNTSQHNAATDTTLLTASITQTPLPAPPTGITLATVLLQATSASVAN